MPSDPAALSPGEHSVGGELGPWSETIRSGLPRQAMMAASSRATLRPEIQVSAVAARHSLVTSSITLRMRKRRPFESWSWTKSTDQRAFWPRLDQNRRPHCPSPACGLCACGRSGPPRGKAAASSFDLKGLQRAEECAAGDNRTGAARPPAPASGRARRRLAVSAIGSGRSCDRRLSGGTPGAVHSLISQADTRRATASRLAAGVRIFLSRGLSARRCRASHRPEGASAWRSSSSCLIAWPRTPPSRRT